MNQFQAGKTGETDDKATYSFLTGVDGVKRNDAPAPLHKKFQGYSKGEKQPSFKGLAFEDITRNNLVKGISHARTGAQIIAIYPPLTSCLAGEAAASFSKKKMIQDTSAIDGL